MADCAARAGPARARIRIFELARADIGKDSPRSENCEAGRGDRGLGTALKLEAPSSSGPALKFWAARLRADDDDDAATEVTLPKRRKLARPPRPGATTGP